MREGRGVKEHVLDMRQKGATDVSVTDELSLRSCCKFESPHGFMLMRAVASDLSDTWMR